MSEIITPVEIRFNAQLFYDWAAANGYHNNRKQINSIQSQYLSTEELYHRFDQFKRTTGYMLYLKTNNKAYLKEGYCDEKA